MLGVYESADSAFLLGFSYHMERKSGFAGGLRTENLNDATTGQSADT
jgi:hypothetical protein